LSGDSSAEVHDRFGAFPAPSVAFGFEADVWDDRAPVDWMMARFERADVERFPLDP